MIKAELTEGMSMVEVLIVFLISHCSSCELRRIKQFLKEWPDA